MVVAEKISAHAATLVSYLYDLGCVVQLVLLRQSIQDTIWSVPTTPLFWNTSQHPVPAVFFKQLRQEGVIYQPTFVAVDCSLVFRNHSIRSPLSNMVWHIRTSFKQAIYVGLCAADDIYAEARHGTKSLEYVRQLDLLLGGDDSQLNALRLLGVPVSILPTLRSNVRESVPSRERSNISVVVLDRTTTEEMARHRLREIGHAGKVTFLQEADVTVALATGASQLITSSLVIARYLYSRGHPISFLNNSCLRESRPCTDLSEQLSEVEAPILDGLVSSLSISEKTPFSWETQTRWRSILERRGAG